MHLGKNEHQFPIGKQLANERKGSLPVTNRLRIRYPADEALFYVDPVLRDRYQKLSLKGTAPDAFRDVHWIVDGERLASGAERATWQLRSGRHRIELRARDDGRAVRSRTVEIRVVSASQARGESAVSARSP